MAVSTEPSLPSSRRNESDEPNGKRQLSERRLREGLDRARAVVGNEALISAIEAVAREHGLTPKQVELVAYSTTRADRTDLVDKLGVSTNTIKTRVRHLLRALDEKSLDSLGKTVLRRALDRVRPVAP